MLPLAAVTLALATEASSPSLDLEARAAARQAQLQAHQALGLATLGGLATAGAVGKWLDIQRESGANASVTSPLESAHQALGLGTGALYLGAAGLALLAPANPYPPAFEGADSVFWHKGLAVLHGAAMASTVALGLVAARSDPAFRPYHQALGATTLGLLAASAAVLAFDF